MVKCGNGPRKWPEIGVGLAWIGIGFARIGSDWTIDKLSFCEKLTCDWHMDWHGLTWIGLELALDLSRLSRIGPSAN